MCSKGRKDGVLFCIEVFETYLRDATYDPAVSEYPSSPPELLGEMANGFVLDYLPKLMVIFHASKLGGRGERDLRSVCSFHNMHNLSELISVRMDDILAELDRARRDPD